MAIAAVTALALSACFSPWKGDTGTFSISTGGSGGGRTIWNGINTDTLEHVITLEGPGPEQTATVTGAGTVQFSVVPGVWNIAIEGRLNGELVAEGSRTVDIKTGSNGAITISMREPTKNTLIEMVRVQGGSFQMGQNGNGNSNNVTPVHTVTLTGFYIGKYEVTQAQYQTVMGTNPSSHTTGADEGEVQEKRPVENVSWYDALVFCNKLSMSEGLSPAYSIGGSTDPSAWGTVPTTTSSVTPWNAVVMVAGSNGYRLPTEAQWEYAAKGGPSASSPYKIYSGSDNIDDVAWHSGSKTHEAGKRYRNELGIYDMSGNVWEWCWDWYDENYYSSSPQTDPPGAPSGSLRVQRGGGYNDDYSTGYFRSAYRKGYYGPYINLGFRVVLPASMGQPSEPPVEPPEEPGMEGFVCANAAQWNEALAEIRDGGSNKTYTINVTGGFDLPGYTAGNTFGSAENINVIIRGNYTIKLDGSGSLLSIGAGQTVTMRDLKLKGRGDVLPNNVPLVMVEGGTFTMEGSASVTGNTNSGGNGGGVAVYANGKFNMSGSAVISGNILTEKNIGGGGALGGNGGGVYVDGGTFNMSGSAVISENTVTVNIQDTGYGGGVYIKNGTFTMSGSAVISGNKATGSDGNGGGVYVSGGAFQIITGTIYGSGEGNSSNTATNGAALYKSPSGGTAEYGTGAAWTGVSNLETTDFTIRVTNGVLAPLSFNVSDAGGWNTAVTAIRGGGGTNGSPKAYTINITDDFNLPGYSDYTFNNVTGITVTINGGNHTITLSGTDMRNLLRINANQTVIMTNLNLRGRGIETGDTLNGTTLVHIEGTNAALTMSGGTISGNNNTGVGGGGVYVYYGGTFTMSGSAKVSGNKAPLGGGVYVTGANSKFEMSGSAVISGNTANSGGGVYVASGGTFQLYSGTIYGTDESNTALWNTASDSAALYKDNDGTAEYWNGSGWQPINAGDNSGNNTIIRQ